MSTNIHIYRRVIFLLPTPKKKKKKVYHPLPFFLDLIITSPYSFLSKRSKYVAIISHFSINNLPPSTLYLCGTQVGIKCQLPPPSYAFGVICFFFGGGGAGTGKPFSNTFLCVATASRNVFVFC